MVQLKQPVAPFFMVSILAVCIFCLSLLKPAACQAAPVSAVIYLQSGTTAVLEISLANPLPTTLIAQIALPPAAQVVSTSPGGAKIERGATLVKWLLKNPAAGSIRFSATSAVALDQQALSGVVLFRRQADGSLVRINAKNR